MAQSLDGLIDFLLEEVALSGEKGLQLSDIVEAATSFYRGQTVHASSYSVNGHSSNSSAHAEVANIDQKFVEQLWKWLGKHPDVLLGADAQYNNHTLDEVEQEYPGYISQAFIGALPNNVDAQGSHQRSGDIEANDQAASLSETIHVRTSKTHTRNRPGPNVFVTTDRMSLAICGHLPDPIKVFPSEWSLLSYIAAARYEGILQGELGRITGQDKRSVPKRTDVLQAKGYIVKTAAYLRGTKTSRLYLSRFAPDGTTGSSNADPRNPRQVEKLTIKYQSNQMFEILKNNPLITQQMLGESLTMTTVGKKKVLSLMIRHFGRVGCIKRVKTAFGPSARPGDLQICIQYLREPGDNDWTDTMTDGVDFDLSVDELAKPYDAMVLSNPDGAAENLDDDFEFELDEDLDGKRALPQWNPDRILANVLYGATRQMGIGGMRNMDARKMITGPFVRRILESLLVKISHRSLLSQPEGVKNLTVVRSKEATDSLLQYIHYALDIFEQKVHEGQASWANIEGNSKVLQLLEDDPAAPIVAAAHLRDKFGFPSRVQTTKQLNGGATSQQALIRQAKVKDFPLAQGGTLADEDDSDERGHGELSVNVPKLVAKRGRPRKSTTTAMEPNDGDYQGDKSSVGHIGRGRPRKFLRGTEKFWKDMFVAAVREADPDYVRTMGTGGVMQSSVGMDVFLARPENFDQTVIKAINAGLPIPGFPEQITDQWVTDTLTILDIPGNGLYFSPTGVLQRSRGSPSKLMIVKSLRLREIDFSDRQRVWDWQMLISSVSHSHRYKPFYPTLQPSKKKTSFVMRAPKVGAIKKRPRMSGPRKGTFYEIPITPTELGLVSEQIDFPAPVSGFTSHSRSSSRSTDVDPELSLHIAQVEAERSGVPQGVRPDTTNLTGTLLPTDDLVMHTISESSRNGRTRRHRKSTQKVIEESQTQNGVRKPDSGITNALHEQAVSESVRVREQLSEDHVARGHSPSTNVLSLPDQAMQSLHLPPPDKNLNSTKELVSAEDYTESSENAPEALLEVECASNGISSQIRDVANPAGDSPANGLSLPDEDANDLTTVGTQPTAQDDQGDGVIAPHTRKRRKTNALESSDDSDIVRPVKRTKPFIPTNRISQRAPAKMCRTIIYDLIKLCSGYAPNDSWTFRRAMTARWAESGIDADPPTAKNVRTNIKALALGARVKNITFAYKGKSGTMVTKSIIAYKKFDNTSPEILALQKKMIEADPEDYVPPELKAEFHRAPSGIINPKSTADSSESEGEQPKTSSTKKRSVPPQGGDAASMTIESAALGFLTLKIRGLGGLNLPEQYSVHYKVPTGPIVDVAPVSDYGSAAPDPPRRRTLRKRRATRFDAETHDIIWANDRQADRPTSLEDIPNIKLARDTAALDANNDTQYALFEAEVDCVAEWEEKGPSASNVSRQELAFINHNTFKQQVGSYLPVPTLTFGRLVVFDAYGKALERIQPVAKSWPVFAEVLKSLSSQRSQSLSKQRPKQKRGKRKTTFVVEDDESDAYASVGNRNTLYDDKDDFSSNDEDDNFAPRKKRKYTRRRRDASPNLRRSSANEFKSKVKTKKSRRPVQVVRYMAEDMQYRIVVSVIVLRTLAGGVERYIDWGLVKRLLPDQEIEHIQAAWKRLSDRYRSDVNDLTESLQDQYLDGLVDGKVPSVNFSNLKDTNWEGILEWALANLEKLQIAKVDDLPTSRDVFDEQNMISVQEYPGIRNTLSFGLLTSQSKKDELIAGVVFGTKMRSTLQADSVIRQSGTRQSSGDIHTKAKSWVFALLLTPDSSYNPVLAHNFLLRLAQTPTQCETLVDKALISLQRDKAISRGKDVSKAGPTVTDTEITGVRTWQISAKFYDQFLSRRQITSSMLKVAARYKLEVLDVAFAQGQPVTIGTDFVSDDGEIVAIINLLALGVLKIRPGNDLPDTRYGLDWENQGYSTRLIDKGTLGFKVILEPVPFAYDYGDPLDDSRSRALIPRGELDDPSGIGRIPPWFDINLDFLPEMWDMVLGAIAGLISIRPGASISELCKSTGNAMGEWAISLMTDYLERISAIRRTPSNDGYETEPWWWMCLATMNDEVEGGNDDHDDDDDDDDDDDATAAVVVVSG